MLWFTVCSVPGYHDKAIEVLTDDENNSEQCLWRHHAAQVSLVSVPDFSFAVTLYEYVNLMILPGLEAFIHYFIRDIILRPMVLPESLNIPLVVRAYPWKGTQWSNPPVYFSPPYECPTQALSRDAGRAPKVRARQLPMVHDRSRPCTHVVLHLGWPPLPCLTCRRRLAVVLLLTTSQQPCWPVRGQRVGIDHAFM